jgi:hypothetical protein
LIVYPGLLEKLRTAALPAAVDEFRSLYFSDITVRFPIDVKVYFASLGLKESDAPPGQKASLIQLNEDQRGFQGLFYKSEFFLHCSKDLQNLIRAFALAKLFIKLFPASLAGGQLRNSGLVERIAEKDLELLLKGSKSTLTDPVDQRALDFSLHLLMPEIFLQKCQNKNMAESAIANFFGVVPAALKFRLGAQYIFAAQVGSEPHAEEHIKSSHASKTYDGKSSSDKALPTPASAEAGLDRLKSGEGMKRLRLLAKKLSDDQV